MLRQRAEHPVECGACRFGVDRPDEHDVEIVAGDRAPVERPEIIGGDLAHAFERPLHRPCVGVRAEERLREDPACNLVRVGLVLPEVRHRLPADALHRLRVEARLSDCDAEEIEGLVEICGKRAQAAVESIGIRVERQFDAEVFELRLEGARIEVGGALVEQPRHHVGKTLLAFRVLRGAAAKGDVHGDDRNRVVFHQPRLEPARAGDVLNGGCPRRRVYDCKRHGGSEEGGCEVLGAHGGQLRLPSAGSR